MSLLENCLEENGRVVLLYIWNQSHWVNCLEARSPVVIQDLWVNCPLDQLSGGQASVGLPSLGPISVRPLRVQLHTHTQLTLPCSHCNPLIQRKTETDGQKTLE